MGLALYLLAVSQAPLSLALSQDLTARSIASLSIDRWRPPDLKFSISHNPPLRRGGPATHCKRTTSQHHTTKYEIKVHQTYEIMRYKS